MRLLYSTLLCLLIACSGFAQTADLQTVYEKSGFTETSRYDETVDFCKRLCSAAPNNIEYRAFGKSPEGRDLPMLLVNFENDTKPLLLIIAGIHAGEIDGKDAGLMLLRDTLVLKKEPGLLDGVRIAFIPILNVDGHERWSANNRPNQRGPKEMGWRTTAQNLNLNRDFVKADAPEIRALLRQINSLDPDFLMDIHVTDGADYQYVLTYSMNDHEDAMPPLRHYNHEVFLPEVKSELKAAGYDFVSQVFFKDDIHIESGIVSPILEPRFSTGYGTVINRPSLLIETHSLKDYHTRVTATYEVLKAVIRAVGTQAEELKDAIQKSERLSANLAAKKYYLSWDTAGDSTMMDFLGVDYERVYSETLGDTVYHWLSTPRTYRIPLFERSRPTDSVKVPYAYIIPAAWMPLLEDVLRLHQIPIIPLEKPLELSYQSYQFTDVTFARKPYEGRLRPSCRRKAVTKKAVFRAGSGVIYVDFPRAQAAIHLLEPSGPDSFVSWGFLNQIFEQKEYAEAYIMDTVATRMLAESPKLTAEYQRKLADSSFAHSPTARLEFFYEHSPFWDAQKDVYPIARITDPDDFQMLKTLMGKNPDFKTDEPSHLIRERGGGWRRTK
jgi:hypothetical protein